MPRQPAAVVGIKHRGPDALAAVRQMKAGDRVRLVREPGNQYDSNAVQVWFLAVHIGYVPKVANPSIAGAMDAGTSPEAVVDIAPIVRGGWLDREPRILISWATDNDRQG